jgi:hypothetical protein
MNKPDQTNKSENASLPEPMKKACCEICSLADAMKDCKNCAFNAYKQASMFKLEDIRAANWRRMNVTKSA